MNEIEKLKLKEQELLAQLAEVRKLEAQEQARIVEEKRLADEKQKQDWLINGVPVLVEKFDSYYGEVAISTPAYRQEFVDYMRTLKTRRYRGDKTNVIALDEWRVCLSGLEELIPKKVISEIVYADGVKEEIEKFLNRARAKIELDHDRNRVLMTVLYATSNLARRFNARHLRDNTKEGTQTFWLPRSELPNVWEGLANEDGVEWADDAKMEAAKEIDKRLRLDEIALAEDYPLELKFLDSEFKLRPFQRKGIAWLREANYQALLADQMGLGKTAQAIATWMLLMEEMNNAETPSTSSVSGEPETKLGV